MGPRQASALPGSTKWPIDSIGTPNRVGTGTSLSPSACGLAPSVPKMVGWLGP